MGKRAILLAVVGLAACAPGAQAPVVEGAWVRLPAVPGRPAAGYFTLNGEAGRPRVLVAVESPSVQRIEMHESVGRGGVMSMRPVARVAVGDTPVAFAPGAKHLMLFGMPREARSGGFLPLAFRFADGGRVEARARIVAAGDPAPR